MKIVLIEDNEMLRKSLSYFLRSHNYEIVEFDNGLDAIAYIHEQHTSIQAVITDLNLPFAGGQQVIRACREFESSRIHILVLTSQGVENTELEVFELGADEFITKPFSPAVLLKRLEKLTSA